MVVASVGLKTAIWNNNIKSFFLLALYPFIMGGLVWGIAGLYGVTMMASLHGGVVDSYALWNVAKTSANNTILEYWPTLLAVISIWFTVALFFHTHMVRALSHAKPATRQDEPRLYNLLENLCISRGIMMPRLEIIEADAMNAFASGISQRSYAITVSRGLLNSLSDDEVEAVLGHELTHILNRDVRLLIISVIFTGMIGFCSQMLWSSIRYSAFRRRGRSSGRTDGRLLLFILAVALILWIGYMATLFTRFAISRRREFMADAGAIELTKNPDAMMRALLRIAGNDRLPATPADIDMMCIENSQPFFGVFSTHPPIEARLNMISAMSGLPVPSRTSAAASSRANPWAR